MNLLAFLNGYKTFTAGIGFIGLGIYEVTQGNTDQGLAHMAEGVAVIGVGHKLDKSSVTGK